MHALRRISAFIFAVLLFSQFSVSQSTPGLASQIVLLNRSLEVRPKAARPSREAVSPDLLSVLQIREKLVEELIRTDPGSVRAVMLSPELAKSLSALSPEVAALIESDVHWSGTVEGAVADDFEHSTSTTHWYLNSGDSRFELFLADGKSLTQHLHRPMTVSGVGTTKVISVEAIHPVHPETTAQGLPALNCTSIGVQDPIVLIMYQPNGGQTYPMGLDQVSFWQPQYFGTNTPPPKSANTYWQEASFGLTSGTGDFKTNLTFTSNEDCTNTDQLASDAIAAAKAGLVDFTNYSRISIIYPVGSCGFGGLGTIGCYAADSRINHPYSITWIPAISYYNNTYVLWGLIAHELGHNLGLAHSSSLNFGSIPLGALDYTDPYPNSGTAGPGVGNRVEYGDPYTVMGGGSYTCGAQYTAFNKSEYLTWMNRTSDIMEITNTGGSFKVVPFENSSGLRALRVLRDPLTSSWMWLEYRQALGNYDSALSTCASPSNILTGANVYYESPYSQDGHLFILDMNAATTPNNFTNGALAAGTSWSDPYSLLTLSVTAADSTGMTVSASYDAPCAALQISSSGVFGSSATSGSITVTAPGNCSWTASTVDSWISFTGTTSGTGNGSVPFSLSANSGTFQRAGYITVQRQSVPLTQKGSATFTSNLSPVFQTGLSGTPTFTFNDPAGLPDLSYINVKIHDSDCQVQVVQGVPSGNWFLFLLDPATNSFSNALTPGFPGTASNANCTLNGGSSSVTQNGNQLQVALAFTFAQSFVGSYRVTASPCDGGGSNCAPDISIGTWQVAAPATPMINSLTPNSGKQGASVPVTIVGANTHFSNSSAISVSGGGVTVSNTISSSATALTATLTIDPNTTASARTLTVTTGGEVVTTPFTVVASGFASLSKLSLTFANQNPSTTSASQPVLLTNNGHATLNISNISIAGEFGLTHNCGSTLAVSASCTLNVTFQPIHVAARTGTVTISDDSPSSPHSIPLSGYGNFVMPLSRPGRPARPSGVNSGVVTRIIVKLGDLGASNASAVTCHASGKLRCSLVSDAILPQGSAALIIDARDVTPGYFILKLQVDDPDNPRNARVPIVVSNDDSATGESR